MAQVPPRARAGRRAAARRRRRLPHARSAGIVLAQMVGAKTVLGTATPSMESYYNAQTGKYGLVELMTRYQGIQLPEVRVVDVKDLRRRKMMSGPFSPP